MKKSFRRLAFAFALVGFAFAGTASAQDFQKNYAVGAGATIHIQNVSGDVNVVGYDGEVPAVAAFKEGRDRDKVEVEDLSSGDAIRLRARYEPNCRCDASIRFEVRLPRSVGYRVGPISTASGNVEVRNVTGEVRVETASGNVRVKQVNGSVNASTASGNVEAEITRVEGGKSMSFSTASGDVEVRVPDSVGADVHLSTASGSVKSDFPLDFNRNHHGSGGNARGQLGGGGTRLRLSSASGNVSLSRL